MISQRLIRTLMTMLLLTTLLISGQSVAHCQIPCGIYDDYARVNLIKNPSRSLDWVFCY